MSTPFSFYYYIYMCISIYIYIYINIYVYIYIYKYIYIYICIDILDSLFCSQSISMHRAYFQFAFRDLSGIIPEHVWNHSETFPDSWHTHNADPCRYIMSALFLSITIYMCRSIYIYIYVYIHA